MYIMIDVSYVMSAGLKFC